MLPRQQRRRQPPSLGQIAQPLALLWPMPLPPPEPAAPWALVQTITYLTKTQRLVTTVLIGRQTIAASCLRTSGKVSYGHFFFFVVFSYLLKAGQLNGMMKYDVIFL